MANGNSHGVTPSLTRVIQHLAREWRSRVRRQIGAGTLEGCLEYLNLPVFTLCKLLAETLGYDFELIAWLVYYCDRARERTPRKEPGHFSVPDPEFDGLPEDYLTELGIRQLDSIYAEFEKCDDDGRSAAIFNELEATHPGVFDAVCKAEAQRRSRAAGTTDETRSASPKGKKPRVNARLIDLLSRQPEAKGWTAERIAVAIHCSASAVVGTNAWKSMRLDREKGAAEHASKRATEKRRK